MRRRGIAIIWIEHIVHVLVQAIDRLVCLDAGRIIADGLPDAVLNDTAVIDAYLGSVGHMSLLEVRSVDARYGLLQAVRNVSLTIEEGETHALIGANGAGKTTLLRVIAGAHRPAAGSVVFDGADITTIPAHKRVSLGIALVPEGRRLFPGLSVEENLSVSAGRRGDGAWTVDRVLEIFPMLQSRAHAKRRNALRW